LKRKLLLLTALLCLGLSALPLQAAPKVVSQVNDELVTDGDLLYILSQHTNGNEAMAMIMMAQMSEEEKITFTTQITDALLLSQAALRKGCQFDPAVARKIRWDSIQVLSQAYMRQVSQGWDLSEKALQAYYEANADAFVQNEAAHVRHILVDSEAKARTILLQLMSGQDFAELAAKESVDHGSARNGGDLGWVERGQTVPSFEEAAFSLQTGRFGGPVQSDFGWHVLEVLERRERRALSYAEARPQVTQALQESYIQKEIETLRAAEGYVIDEEAIKRLGPVTP
jgi:peptidyl-prolyl cis-trans isomerase C